jgi:hypothetical protein
MGLRKSLKNAVMKSFPNAELGRILFYLPKIREYDFSGSTHFASREKMYDYINKELVGDSPLSYLEFGVYQGNSVKYWANIHKNKDSEFVGFDTFTGLPENWYNLSGTMRKNHFDTNGKTPEIDDARVSFVKGMFQDTLTDFLKSFTPKKKLIIHNDSDLYSSTLYTMAKMHPLLAKGTIVIFDEFSSPLHEMRAWADFTNSHLVKYKILAHTAGYDQVALTVE